MHNACHAAHNKERTDARVDGLEMKVVETPMLMEEEQRKAADDDQNMSQSLAARDGRVWRGRSGKCEAQGRSSEPQSPSLALLAASLAKMDCRCSSVCCSEVFSNLFWSNLLRVAFESTSPAPVWPVRVACQLVLFLRAHLSRGSRGQKHSKEQPSRTCLAARLVARK